MEGLLADSACGDKALARRSLDLTYLDDIPEERPLSAKSSEEKEITRLDSGLGEWDSESSRKTSFSSQGRLSPDCAMSKVIPPLLPLLPHTSVRRCSSFVFSKSPSILFFSGLQGDEWWAQ